MNESYQKDPLRYVLSLAYSQAMKGKGLERHADNKPFNEQIWRKITECCGLGFPIGQAMKKDQERMKLSKELAIKELLGAINYLSMAIIYLIDDVE